MNETDLVLDSVGQFTPEEKALFKKAVLKKHFRKNDVLINLGAVCTEALYIIDGSAYEFDYIDIDENITGMFTAGDWCLNYRGFIQQSPSCSTIRVYADLSAFSLTISAAHELIATSPRFFQLGVILEKLVTRLHYFDKGSTAQEKYAHLLESRPDLFQQFPLKMIASYLKIAPETLSRLRRLK